MTEIELYLREALRVWNCLSMKYRQRFTFTTEAAVPFYNLHEVLNNLNPSNLVQHTVTVQDIVEEIQYHLMEPVSPALWIGTDMFTLEQVVSAIERRRDQFLVETGVEQIFETGGFTMVGAGRLDFPESVLDIRRLEWVDTDGLRTHLWRSDEYNRDSLDVGWMQTTNTPEQFSIILQQPLRIQLMPPPALSGILERISTESGPVLDVLANTLLGVPDDWAWVVKYGAMADLLGIENQARDPQRANYCEQRYRMGVELCNEAPIVLRALINNQQASLVSIEELDTQAPGWTNVPGPPDTIGVSHYMLAMSPVPDAEYGISLDVLRTAPVPLLPGDPVQLGVEELDAILDYAHHIGSFKEGGVEFDVTQRNFKNMVQQASVFNERLSAMSFYRDWFEDKGKKEQDRRSRRDSVAEKLEEAEVE